MEDWFATALRQWMDANGHRTHEQAARVLGVPTNQVTRWLGGQTPKNASELLLRFGGDIQRALPNWTPRATSKRTPRWTDAYIKYAISKGLPVQAMLVDGHEGKDMEIPDDPIDPVELMLENVTLSQRVQELEQRIESILRLTEDIAKQESTRKARAKKG